VNLVVLGREQELEQELGLGWEELEQLQVDKLGMDELLLGMAELVEQQLVLE
jgi:hypothetical protein